MSKKEKIRNLFLWPKTVALLIFIFNLSLASYAASSNYYDVSNSNRPPSVFSICCCSKENDEGSQVIYSCKYIEDIKCPENSKQYKTSIGDCPSNLMFTKYSQEQNKYSGDN